MNDDTAEEAFADQTALLGFFIQYLQCIGYGTLALDIETQLTRANHSAIVNKNSELENTYKYVEKALRPMQTLLSNSDHQFFAEKIIPSLNERALQKCADDPFRVQQLFRVEIKCLLFLVRYNKDHTAIRHEYMSTFESRYERLFDKSTKQFCQECMKFYDENSLPVLQLGNASDDDGSHKFRLQDGNDGNSSSVDTDFVQVIRQLNSNAASAVIPQLITELRCALTHALVNIGQLLQSISRGFTRYGRVVESPLEEFAKLKDLTDCIQTCEFLQTCMTQTSTLQHQLMDSKMLEERIMVRYKSMLDSALQLLIRFVQEASNNAPPTTQQPRSRNTKIEKRRKTEFATSSSNITLAQKSLNINDDADASEVDAASRTMSVSDLAASFLPVIKNISETQAELQSSAKEWDTFQGCVQESNNQVAHAYRLFEALARNLTDLKQRLAARARDHQRATPTNPATNVQLSVSRSQHVIHVGTHASNAPVAAEASENSATINRLKRQLGANQFLLEESYQLFSNYLKYNKIDSDEARFAVKKLQATLEYQTQKDGIKSIKPTESSTRIAEQQSMGDGRQLAKSPRSPNLVVSKPASSLHVHQSKSAERVPSAKTQSSPVILAAPLEDKRSTHHLRQAQRRARASNERRSENEVNTAVKNSPSRLSPRSAAEQHQNSSHIAPAESNNHLHVDNDGFRLTTDSHLSPLHASPSIEDFAMAYKYEHQREKAEKTSSPTSAQPQAKTSREHVALKKQQTAESAEEQEKRPRSAHSNTDQSSTASATTADNKRKPHQDLPKPPPRPLRALVQQQQKQAEESIRRAQQKPANASTSIKATQQRPVPTVNVIKDEHASTAQQRKAKLVKHEELKSSVPPVKPPGYYEKMEKASKPKPVATESITETKKPTLSSTQRRANNRTVDIEQALQAEKGLRMPQLNADNVHAQKEAIARGLPADDVAQSTSKKSTLPTRSNKNTKTQKREKDLFADTNSKSKSPGHGSNTDRSKSSRSVSAARDGGVLVPPTNASKRQPGLNALRGEELKNQQNLKMKVLESDGNDWKQRYSEHRERVVRASTGDNEDVIIPATSKTTTKLNSSKKQTVGTDTAKGATISKNKPAAAVKDGHSDAVESVNAAAGAASSTERERPKTHTIKHRDAQPEPPAKPSKLDGKKVALAPIVDDTAAAAAAAALAAAAAAADQTQHHQDEISTNSKKLSKKSSKHSLKGKSSRKDAAEENDDNDRRDDDGSGKRRQKPPRTSKTGKVFAGGGSAGASQQASYESHQMPGSLNAPGSTAYYHHEERYQINQQFPNDLSGNSRHQSHLIFNESSISYNSPNSGINFSQTQQQLPLGGVARDVFTTPTAAQTADVNASDAEDVVEIIDTAIAEPFYSSAENDAGGVFEYVPAPSHYPITLPPRGRIHQQQAGHVFGTTGQHYWQTNQPPASFDDDENVSDGYAQYEMDDNAGEDRQHPNHSNPYNSFYYFPG